MNLNGISNNLVYSKEMMDAIGYAKENLPDDFIKKVGKVVEIQTKFWNSVKEAKKGKQPLIKIEKLTKTMTKDMKGISIDDFYGYIVSDIYGDMSEVVDRIKDSHERREIIQECELLDLTYWGELNEDTCMNDNEDFFLDYESRLMRPDHVKNLNRLVKVINYLKKK